MTGPGHTLTGTMAGIPLGFFVFEMNAGLIISIATVVACILGSTAPDWLEIPYKSKSVNRHGKTVTVVKRVIKHRGVTHILSLWVFGFIWTYLYLKKGYPTIIELEMQRYCVFILFGFFAGGILHLLGDIPNKKKIPMFTTFDGISFNLWESGKHERSTCAALLVLTLLFVFYDKSIFNLLDRLTT